MPDLIAALHLGDVGPWALITLVVLLVLSGRLVPRQQLLDVQADRERWHKAADDWQATAAKLGMSVERLLVHAETTTHALGEIQSSLERRGAP